MSWALKQAGKVIKAGAKKKSSFENWADKFEGGTPSRAEFDKLSKADKSKAVVHMGSKRAAKPKSNVVDAKADDLKFDQGSTQLQSQIAEGRTKKRTPNQDLNPKQQVTQEDSFQNLKLSESDSSVAQDARRITNQAQNTNKKKYVSVQDRVNVPLKSKTHARVQSEGGNVDRYKDRDAVKEHELKAKILRARKAKEDANKAKKSK